MGNLVFPFRYRYVAGIGRVFFPSIRVGLNTIDGLVRYDFVVDTGSDLTILPFFMAYKLKIDLQKAKQSEAVGIGGYVVKTWHVHINLVLENREIKVRAAITNENSTPFLLGRVDLLDVLYCWNFDARRKKIVFEEV